MITLLLSASGILRAAAPVCAEASPEARALLNYLYAQYGHKTLAGQMWVPWGIDEMATVQEITGKLPAVCGFDYIHEHDNARQNALAIDWWRAGGIVTFMWHWGAPTQGEGYNASKATIDISRCFEPGTPEHTALWADLERIADHLTVLRDARVPVLWRPMHECDGGWFWYSKGGSEAFIRLWRTMFDYFVHERKLTNLIWVLCHSDRIKPEWNPGKTWYDLAGADTYARGVEDRLFKTVQSIHGTTVPIVFHECGALPDPNDSFAQGITWSWWMLWHTDYLSHHNRQALIEAYQSERVITRDELPDLMTYLEKTESAPEASRSEDASPSDQHRQEDPSLRSG